ncbi:MAG: response regulator, partial [Candidatus Thiodiazotropha sp.]
TGIGLSVSQGIARDHGGELCLEASEQGAVFSLWLDLKLSDKTETKQPDINGAQPNLQEHILIVDDESEIAELLEEILTSAGLMATQVNSGRKALDWLGNHQCDILLCDIRMPDMDGPALWRVLQQDYPELATRTAFITGDTLSASISPFLRATARPWLEKPFTPDQVLELVARLTD